MPLVTRPAEPLTEDPFSDPLAGGEVPDFPAQRYIDAGATEDELLRLATYYDEGTLRQRREAARWIESASDDDFTEALTLWRQFVADAEAEAALTAGTVDEVLDRVRSAPDDERMDLARRTLTAEQSKEGDDVRTTLVAGLEKVLVAEPPPPAPEGTQAAPDGSADAGAPDSTVPPADGQPGPAAEGSDATS